MKPSNTYYKEQDMSKRVTKAQMEGALKRFMELEREGQITLECDEARDFKEEVEKTLGLGKKCSRVCLLVQLNEIQLPPGADPWDKDSYVLWASIPGGEVESIEIDEVSDVDN
jgi:hypothetical protein